MGQLTVDFKCSKCTKWLTPSTHKRKIKIKWRWDNNLTNIYTYFHGFPMTIYSFYLFPMENWGFSCPKHGQLMSEPEFEPRDHALHLGPSPCLTWVFHHLWSKTIMMADTTYRYHFPQHSNSFKDADIIGKISTNIVSNTMRKTSTQETCF